MESTNRILELLYDRGEGFCSPTELARASRLDAAGVQRRLEMLVRGGLAFERSGDEGIRLVRPMRLISHLIERNLATLRVGRSVVCFNRVGSTNDIAFDAARSGEADGLVILAESQHSGRGRQGRKWLDEPGTSLACSIVLLNEDKLLAHEPLTIAAGLAVAEAIERSCGLEVELKWPNDVLLDDRKVAGVLIELRDLGRPVVVVGVGMNVNAVSPDSQIDAPATCLAEHVGRPVERIEVVRSVLSRLDYWVEAVAAGRVSELHDSWVSRCGMINQRVTIASAGQQFVGHVLDVSPLEGIILAGDDGQRLHLPAGRATVLS